MQQLRWQFKLLSTLSAATVIFTLILMITLVTHNQQGFDPLQSQSTPATISHTNTRPRYSQKKITLLSHHIALTCLVLAVYWGFSTQNNSYSKAYYILTSGVIIFLIPTSGYFTSRTSETQPKSASELVTGIVIMVQSWIVFILVIAIQMILFIQQPLKLLQMQNHAQSGNSFKKIQPVPRQHINNTPPINKQLISPEIQSRPFFHLKESYKNEILLDKYYQIQNQPQLSTSEYSPTKQQVSRPITLFSELSDCASRPQMMRFFERRNNQQKLRKLQLRQQIEKRKQMSRSPSQQIPQQALEESNVVEEQCAKIPNSPIHHYIQQIKPTPILQTDKQQEDCIQFQPYKRQPNKITNLFDPAGPNDPQKEDIVRQETAYKKQDLRRRRLYNIIQWNLKENKISRRLNEPSIYESHIQDKVPIKQADLIAIALCKRPQNS